MILACKACKEGVPAYCQTCFENIPIGLSRIFKKKVWKNAGGKCENIVNGKRCNESDECCLTVHHEDKMNHPYNPKKAKLMCLNCHIGRIHRNVK